jgi:hypothetical protein
MDNYARVAITFVTAVMVISTPVFTLVNPFQVSAASTDNTKMIDTSNYHSTPRIAETPLSSTSFSSSPSTPITSAPSALSQDGGDFTAQAELSLMRTTQTSNIVNSRSYYDIMFRTSTSGEIKTVEIDFPEGTYVGVALLVEAIGIGPGRIAGDNVDDKITYTVTDAENVPANTRIRIQLSNINNPSVPSDSYTVTITTKDSLGNIIDGPSAPMAYIIKQIGTNDIADDAITDAKLSLDSVYTIWADGTPGNFEAFYKRNTISFDPTIDLSNNAGTSSEPAVATSGNNVYVVWRDDTSGNDEILYRRSTDGGATFGDTVNLSDNVGNSTQPAVATSGNNVYVVWRDDTSGNNEILYKRSTNDGATFGATINLSNNAGDSITPAVAASGDNVYVVWTDGTPGNPEILYKRSTDGGATFGATINLSNNAGNSAQPAVAAFRNLPV